MIKHIFLFLFSSFLFFSCSRHNINEKKDWQRFFTEEGIDSATFEVFDNTHDQVYILNIPRASKPYSPASTFKIFNSLVGLETNVAPDINFIINWDGVKRSRESWNKNMDMKEAFEVSCVPYFQELARKIGKDTLQHYLDSCKYGNKKIGDKVDEFWLNDSLKISPDEQLGFVKKMYFDKLPFSMRAQRLVRSMMLHEANENYKLYYKTGTSQSNKCFTAWLLGYIEKIEIQKNIETKKMETNFRPYFFVMHFDTKDTTETSRKILDKRVGIAKKIFKDLSIIK